MASSVLRPISAEQRAAEVARAREGVEWMVDMASEVPTSSLDAQQRQRLWAYLKQHCPERVAFLADPATKALMQATGAVPTFPRALVRAALQPQAR